MGALSQAAYIFIRSGQDIYGNKKIYAHQIAGFHPIAIKKTAAEDAVPADGQEYT